MGDQGETARRWVPQEMDGDGWAALGYRWRAGDRLTAGWVGVYRTREEAHARCDRENARHAAICGQTHQPRGYRCMWPYGGER